MGQLFEEQDFQSFFMDILIFISGQEVSDWLTGSVSYSYAGHAGMNECNFTLTNPLDKFVLTKDNIQGDALADEEEGEGAPLNSWTLDGDYDESIKKAIYEYKRDSALNVSDPDTTIKRWPLGEGDLIFNKHDPIRVFMHDPRTEEDIWFPVFAGFINDPGKVTQDYITGKSEFQVTCYDIRGLMQKMRVQINPVQGLVVPELIIGGEEFFADFILTGQSLTHIFAKNSFEDVIEQLIVGSLGGVVLPKPQQTGVGELGLGTLPAKLGALTTGGPIVGFEAELDEEDTSASSSRWKVFYDPEQNLEAWNDLILFGESLEPWDRNKVNEWGRNTRWDGTHSPSKQNIYILLPDEKNTGATNLVGSYSLAWDEQRTFETRFEIISSFTNILDYNWIVSGSGDMFFEFPMWDFQPKDFGLYRSAYTVSKHLIDDDVAEEAGEATTIVTVTGGIAFKPSDFLATTKAAIIPRAIVASPTMITKYGAHSQHTIPFPFAKDTRSLMNLALVEFQKRLSNIGAMTMRFVYRPFMLINRPILNDIRNKMATIQAISYSITPNGVSTVDVTLKYLRRKDAVGNYLLLTGGKELAASYRRRFQDPFNNRETGILTYPDFSDQKGAIRLSDQKTSGIESASSLQGDIDRSGAS